MGLLDVDLTKIFLIFIVAFSLVISGCSDKEENKSNEGEEINVSQKALQIALNDSEVRRVIGTNYKIIEVSKSHLEIIGNGTRISRDYPVVVIETKSSIEYIFVDVQNETVVHIGRIYKRSPLPTEEPKLTSTPPVRVNTTFIENAILKKDEIKSVIGEEFEVISYEFAKNFTILKVFVQTPCADYSIKYSLANDTVISIDNVYPWKKTIKEEPVSEEEKQRFLAVALNDSRVKEVLKGKDFNVSMVKYVMYMACKKARDPDSVYITFKVNSEIYRVVLLPYEDALKVAGIEKVV